MQVAEPATYRFRFNWCDDRARLLATPPGADDSQRVVVAACGTWLASDPSTVDFLMETGEVLLPAVQYRHAAHATCGCMQHVIVIVVMHLLDAACEACC